MIGRLLPDTIGCVDVNEGGAHAHACDAEPGGIVRTEPGDDGHPAAWRLGTEIQMDRHTSPGIPYCTKLADFADPLRAAGAEARPDPEGTVHAYQEAPPECATFQWKGTTTNLDFTCECGVACEIRGRDFVYAVMCPACSAIYVCRDWVTAELVSV